jgi:endonuclease/exonuclease/phosphatase family metal-dependent hydrolase
MDLTAKIMTFNLRVNVESDGSNAWPYRVKKVADVINEQKPLIIGTQEGNLDMLNDLSEELPEYKWVGQGRFGGKADEFCAIFYRQEEVTLVDTEDFWLSETPLVPGSRSWETDYPRMCTIAHFRLTNDKEVLLFNTHLDHISQNARINGIKLIVENMKMKLQVTGLPALLTGDFNSEPDNEVIKYLEEETYLNSCYKNEDMMGTTYHDFDGGEDGPLIDYIYHTDELKQLQMEIDRTNFDGKYPSDHYPVWATYSL